LTSNAFSGLCVAQVGSQCCPALGYFNKAVLISGFLSPASAQRFACLGILGITSMCASCGRAIQFLRLESFGTLTKWTPTEADAHGNYN
jgi:hypothetical protein